MEATVVRVVAAEKVVEEVEVVVEEAETEVVVEEEGMVVVEKVVEEEDWVGSEEKMVGMVVLVVDVGVVDRASAEVEVKAQVNLAMEVVERVREDVGLEVSFLQSKDL